LQLFMMKKNKTFNFGKTKNYFTMTKNNFTFRVKAKYKLAITVFQTLINSKEE
jgi:hypothetical protein